MSGKRQAVRDELTERLLAAARQRIHDHGLAGLRTRDITSDAGCGLGTIYKCFDDLDDLILRVNSQTLAQLSKRIAKAIHAVDDPRDQLQVMAKVYLEFATRNRNLSSALFDHRMANGAAMPAWHVSEHQVLLDYISTPLSELFPELTGDALQLRTRSIFAAVNGVIASSLEGRFISVSQKVFRKELAAFVDIIVSGQTAKR